VSERPPAVLQARGISKRLGEGRASRQLLRGLDLQVERGEMVAVLGRSGSGKSTLLHLLGGLDRPDSGSIHVAGEALTGASEGALSRIRLRRLGFVFQSFQLIEELTGAENVMLAASLPGAPAGGAERAAALIDKLDLAAVADRPPHELSGGEQQRFAIARALVNDPLLVLADEATGSLDASTGAAVLELLYGLSGEGRAVVMVTHEPQVAAVADRVLRLTEGRLEPQPGGAARVAALGAPA
jgi:ABC-type lipoprotein export system ATPase subunit